MMIHPVEGKHNTFTHRSNVTISSFVLETCRILSSLRKKMCKMTNYVFFWEGIEVEPGVWGGRGGQDCVYLFVFYSVQGLD